jgi:hypothetical protein
MVVKGKKRQDTNPNREHLRHDRDVIIHRRLTSNPAPFVSKFSVREGVSTLEILRGGEKGSEGRKRNEGK